MQNTVNLSAETRPRPERGISGIHHVTAIARDAAQNVNFYSQLLGLRLVKKTVNFDDPGAYHLYYGDGVGRPGSIMTFFPWAMARLGSPGVGQATATSFAVPQGALDFWRSRLGSAGIHVEDGPRERFGESALRFADPDGLILELVEQGTADLETSWHGASVPPHVAPYGFAGVTLTVADGAGTAAVLELMGYRRLAEDGGRTRFALPGGGLASSLDLLVRRDLPPGRVAAGTVHHVAFRVPDDAAQLRWAETLRQAGLFVTEVKDRQYFHSIYFREPGGVLFEIATDPPGFTVDEAPENLGEGLKLPPWLESRRFEIEAALPRLPEREAAEEVGA